MMPLIATTDIIRTTTSSAAALDIVLHYVQANASTGAFSGVGRAVAALSSATSHHTLAGPGGSDFRTLKTGSWRNKDASLSVDVTVAYRTAGPTDYELIKVTLKAGETLEYIEGIGFFTVKASAPRTGLVNVATADQSIGASTTAYLTGSAITLPNPVVAGMVLRWTYQLSKTAAATAARTVALRFGTGGSTSDTARNSFTADTETAVADEAIEQVIATIRGPIGASCVVEAVWTSDNNLSTTGFSNTARKAQVRQATSSAFDITPAGTIAGLSIATGASHALTVRQVHAELLYAGA